MPYQAATGNNNAAGLATVSPQPSAPGAIKYAEVRYTGEGGAYFCGYAQMSLLWTNITRAQRATILTAFGLSNTVSSALVTVQVRNNANSFANYNAIAIYKQDDNRVPTGWTGLEILLNKMVAL